MFGEIGGPHDLRKSLRAFAVTALAILGACPTVAADAPAEWKSEWPRTDFGKATVRLAEIRSVIGRDRIPAIDQPKFVSVAAAEALGLPASEPVIAIAIGARARAYPLRILTWHEIVNDTLGGIPIAVTFCPLCNSAIVFDRRIDGRVLTFGTTGKLRNSDLVMYDRETESWWQQYLGEGLVGTLSGKKLAMLPMRVESFARFKERHGGGEVLVPHDPGARAYGRNPYARYDSSARPFLYDGPLPEGVPPLERVVVVDGEAWTFALLRQRRRIERGDLVITWEPGQNSALDNAVIADGRDVGNVIVQRRGPDGSLADAVHDVSFAFAFRAFFPRGRLHHM
jgi:hypothetical protein